MNTTSTSSNRKKGEKVRKSVAPTQDKLAAILKIAPNSVARLERGERRI
jgi:DNA-binding XRE family transcriptional regulator